MKNLIQSGDRVNLTAPGGGVLSGVGYKLGTLFVVALASVAAGLEFVGLVEGVVDLPLDAGLAVTEGDKVDWDDTAKDLLATTTGDVHAGVALQTIGAGAGQTCLVKLTRG